MKKSRGKTGKYVRKRVTEEITGEIGSTRTK
jgi:hypothetical protein